MWPYGRWSNIGLWIERFSPSIVGCRQTRTNTDENEIALIRKVAKYSDKKGDVMRCKGLNAIGTSIRKDKSVRWLLIILLIAVTLRLLVLGGIWPDRQKILQPDSGGYDRLGFNLAKHHTFSGSERAPFEPDVSRTPGYPLFLAIAYIIFGHAQFIVILVQELLGVITVYVTYRIGRVLFNRNVGLIAAGFMAVDVGQILYANQLLTETLFTLLLSLSMYYLITSLKENRTREGILAGIFLGLATLCRPVTFYLPAFLILIFALCHRTDWLSSLRRYLITIICFVAMLSPWLGRNYYLFGELQLSSNQGITLLFYNTAYLRAKTKSITFEEAQSEIRREVQSELRDQDVNPLRKSAIYQRRALDEILQHPFDYAFVHSRGIIFQLFFPDATVVANMLELPTQTGIFADFLTKGIKANLEAIQNYCSMFPVEVVLILWIVVLLQMGTLAISYLLAIYGVLIALKARQLLAVSTLGLVAIYLLLAVGPVASYGRYRLPSMPYIYLLAALGLWKASRSKLLRRQVK